MPITCRFAVNESFTNAKIAENDVQNIFHIDASSEPAQRRRGRAQFLGDQLFSRVGFCRLGYSAVERCDGFLKRTAMARAGDNAGFHRREIFLGKSRQAVDQRIDPIPICRRN